MPTGSLYPPPHVSGHTVQKMDKNGLREFRPFVEACARVGLGRSKSYQLAAQGLIETVLIGRRRFVYLDSLYSLPERVGRQTVRGAQP